MISIATHHNSIHMIRKWPSRLTEGTLEKHLENTPMSSPLRVPSHLFRSRSAGFLWELHSISSLRRRCFALCESPLAENWRTNAAEIMQHPCVKRATVTSNKGCQPLTMHSCCQARVVVVCDMFIIFLLHQLSWANVQHNTRLNLYQ